MNHQQFHITEVRAWPESPLPVPPLVRVESRLDSTGTVIVPVSPEAAYMVESRQVSGETYLRLIHEVDLDDPDAILTFVQEFGVLGGSHAYGDAVDDVLNKRLYRRQLVPRIEWQHRERAWRTETKAGGRPSSEDEWRLQQASVLNGYVETLSEFRFAARCIRDLTAAWRVFKDGRDTTDIVWTSPDPRELWILDSPSQAARLFQVLLGSFLRAFRPSFTLSLRFTDPGERPDVQASRVPHTASLYAICALELFNHIVLHADYRECGNERCKRAFVRQQGGSTTGQHWSRGVIYCSPACARAVAQRNYRRRQLASESP